MVDWFANAHPVMQAALAGSLTWGLTALGAAAVFVSRQPSRRHLDLSLGFAAGVMIAASFWSLLAPAIEMSARSAVPAWLPALIGFLLGGLTLRLIDRLLPHLHVFARRRDAEGPSTTWKRSVLLVLAITMHNIPEGLAVGVGFAAAAGGAEGASLGGALALTIGIGLQNLPEGAAVAVPLRAEGMRRGRAFGYGQLSGLVEPLAAVGGAAAVLLVGALLPYALAFAAGAMFFVVIEEVVPECQGAGNADAATVAALLGFAVMMVLDVALS